MTRPRVEDVRGTLPPVEFSTDDTPTSDRFDAWGSRFGAVHDVEVYGPTRAAFEAHGRNWRLGPILIGVFRTPARRAVPTPRNLRSDDLDHIVLRVPRTGSIRSRSEFGSVAFGPSEIAVGCYADGYDEDHTAGEWVTAIFPRDAFPLLKGRVPVPQVLKGTPAMLLADFLLSLPARLEVLPPSEVPQVERIAAAMISACLSEAALDGASPAGDRELALRERVERIISTHLASPRLTPGRIADLAGVSRSALYRAYEQDGGIAARVLRRRLDLVWRDLTSRELADVPIAKIAEGRGLYNVASFHRAFRRQYGVTPGDIRSSRSVGSAGGSTGAAPSRPALEFIDLLRPKGA